MNILIIDDHPMVRQGLRMTLQDAGLVVKDEAGSAVEALALLKRQRYGLVIVDIDLPDFSGLDVIKSVRSYDTQLPVLVLSLHSEQNMSLRAIKAGANGFLCKTAPPETLLLAVQHIASGRKYFSSEVMYQLLKQSEQNVTPLAHDALSDREYQVMCLIAKGSHVIEIAEQLGVTPTTVSTYRTRILEKMHMKNNAEMTRYALSHQLIN